ncbi:hypothetical protein [Fimbriiglobus ruber]|uniref:hypothetical protein n=1 Tax=Fimbriiglobus ruber TaxID=1908690 RepID=UPI001EE6DAD2|nr:hypothetical protein [Fimbriiglobus ruber]
MTTLMTESEWLAATDPKRMLEFNRVRASARKLRLLACACCREVWHLLEDKQSRRVVAIVEKCADGTASKKEVRSVKARSAEVFYQLKFSSKWSDGERKYGQSIVRFLGRDSSSPVPTRTGRRGRVSSRSAFEELAELDEAFGAALDAVEATSDAVDRLVTNDPRASDDLVSRQSTLARDIFGNPFRPAPLDPAWQTSTVLSLAEGIYADRAFDRLPILADALEESGCDNTDLLNHCRSEGPHARGCWAVDLLLGKE